MQVTAVMTSWRVYINRCQIFTVILLVLLIQYTRCVKASLLVQLVRSRQCSVEIRVEGHTNICQYNTHVKVQVRSNILYCFNYSWIKLRNRHRTKSFKSDTIKGKISLWTEMWKSLVVQSCLYFLILLPWSWRFLMCLLIQCNGKVWRLFN